MRIYAFTAGAAQMYCGSCLRDNALAAQLKADGHDVVLMPVYTPTLVDEENVSSSDHVFFGGISVYLQQVSRLFRKTPWFLDRLWDSTLTLRLASKRSIPVNPRFLGEMTVSMLEGPAGPYRKEFEKLARYLERMEKPDVATLPNSLLIGMAKPVREALGCPVYVTLQGEDLFLENLEEPFRSRALQLIRSQVDQPEGFIAVSEFGARLMAAYLGISSQRMHIVPLGVNTSDLQMREERNDGVFRIGYLARVAPEKSLHQLCEAYYWMRREGGLPPSRLEAAGYLAPEHKPYLKTIEKQMKAWGLEAEFHYHGALDRLRKIEFLRSLDVMCVPSIYAETKGLYVLEAMACGVPVVSPNHGSFPEMIHRTGGGLLAEPNHPVSFGRELLRLYQDQALRRWLGERGYRGVRQHYTKEQMAQKAVAVLSGVSRNPVC
ncbi:MAG: glycosyltransferase family 4 protein [Bryobacteraceae bacterium]|nr:glycosyltransferase family 4 protein [Bryobacteraceae bacterium]MDW8379777.1 glycosyltransferase family 4 protein [Bryobacterales bacterium]